MIFKTATLGCKVNQYETQWLRAAFLANGWLDADDEKGRNDDVEIVVVNTCSVTAESDAKSRKLVAHFAKEFPNAEIVVIGCYAASDPERVKKLPNVGEVVPDKRKLPQFLRRRGLEIIPTGVDKFAERSRAYVKVQDGCRVGCAYCIIPQTRPYLQSRPIADVLDEATRLAAQGYREIVLTGIHLEHYGLDFYPPTPEEGDVDFERPTPLETYLARQARVPEAQRVDLATLLQALTDLKLPRLRFRLGSLEAVEVADRLVELVRERREQICPHFHLSMQSGDDDVLRAMKRRWLSAPYLERCRSICERVPNAALTTDVIVGFPGETDAQFERTCDVVRALHFSKVHVFRFSARPGSVAADLPNQIPPEVKKERAARLIQIAREEREKFAQTLVGTVAQIVVEDSDGDAKIIRGENAQYYEVEAALPEGATIRPGDLVDVALERAREDLLLGTICNAPKSPDASLRFA